MSKSPVELLRHILKEIQFVESNTNGLELRAFLDNEILQHAFVRSIEIIGEAVKNIPSDLKQSFPEAQWKKIAGTRDKMIHEYFEIDLEIVWGIISEKLPVLKKVIEKMIAEYH